MLLLLLAMRCRPTLTFEHCNILNHNVMQGDKIQDIIR